MKDKSPKNKNILAIDFGSSKVGLAFSEKGTSMAFSFGILKNDQKLWEELEKIVEERMIEKILVGSPQWEEKSEDLIRFVAESKKRLMSDVEIVEEMFTTKMARENLKEAGKKDLAQDDAEAARIMLEDYLDRSA